MTKKSVARRVADIWGAHQMWAEQRDDEWTVALKPYPDDIIASVISELMIQGQGRPTLPTLVSRCESFKAEHRPKREQPKSVVYVHKLDGLEADYNAFGQWKDALGKLRADGHGSDVDRWLTNQDIEISDGTVWVDISHASTDSRYVMTEILLKGEVTFGKMPEPLARIELPFTLVTIQEKLGGLSVGIKTRSR